MTKSSGKHVISLYSNIACSALGVGNQQGLSNDLKCDPFRNTVLQDSHVTCSIALVLLSSYISTYNYR